MTLAEVFPIQAKQLQQEIIELKLKDLEIESKLTLIDNNQPSTSNTKTNEISIAENPIKEDQYINTIEKMTFQKWFALVTITVEDFKETFVALIDSGADTSCIKEGIIPTKYCERTKEKLMAANGEDLEVKYKFTKGSICNNEYCIRHNFIIVNNINHDVILGTPFLIQIYPFLVSHEGISVNIMGKIITFKFLTPIRQKELQTLQTSSIYKTINTITKVQQQINYIKEEKAYLKIEEQINDIKIQKRISELEELFQKEICADIPNAFWDRKQHMIELSYEKDFEEKNIPTKARPIQMNSELLEFCKKEIKILIEKGLITPSKSPWSCAAFYVMNQE